MLCGVINHHNYENLDFRFSKITFLKYVLFLAIVNTLKSPVTFSIYTRFLLLKTSTGPFCFLVFSAMTHFGIIPQRESLQQRGKCSHFCKVTESEL